jgi:hypothetical protein
VQDAVTLGQRHEWLPDSPQVPAMAAAISSSFSSTWTKSAWRMPEKIGSGLRCPRRPKLRMRPAS